MFVMTVSYIHALSVMLDMNLERLDIIHQFPVAEEVRCLKGTQDSPAGINK